MYLPWETSTVSFGMYLSSLGTMVEICCSGNQSTSWTPGWQSWDYLSLQTQMSSLSQATPKRNIRTLPRQGKTQYSWTKMQARSFKTSRHYHCWGERHSTQSLSQYLVLVKLDSIRMRHSRNSKIMVYNFRRKHSAICWEVLVTTMEVSWSKELLLNLYLNKAIIIHLYNLAFQWVIQVRSLEE